MLFYSITNAQDLVPLWDSPSIDKSFYTVSNSNFDIETGDESIITVLQHDGNHARHTAPQSLYRFSRCYFLILPSEMAASGFPAGEKITSIGFNYKYGTNLATKGFFKVYFQNTSESINTKTSNWNSAISQMTLVNADTLQIQTSPGYFDISLNQCDSFTYSGGGIYVAFEYSNPSGPLASVSNVSWSNKFQPVPILRSVQTNDSMRVITDIASNLRAEIRFGTIKKDIVSVGPIYSMGMQNILPCIDSNFVRTVVNHKRNAADTIIVNTSVKNVHTLMISKSFSDTIISNVQESKTIVHNYIPENGVHTDSIIVTAFVNGEDIVKNNKAAYIEHCVSNSFSHYIPSQSPNGGVGLSVGTGDYVARFHSPCDISICAVDMSFFAETGWGWNPYKVILYSADGAGGSPGTLLHISPQRSTPQAFSGVIQRSTYFPNPPVVIPAGYYYVGYKQLEERNLRVSYQTEYPIRPGELFYTTPEGSGSWIEFGEISPYRFDISPRTFNVLKLKLYLEGFTYQYKMISDTVRLKVRSNFPPYGVFDSTSAVADTSGIAYFNLVKVNWDSCYYFDVSHRNHIRTFSSVCAKLNGAPTYYDFTWNASAAYGNNQDYIPGMGYAIYGGDCTQDGAVDLTDVTAVYNDASGFVTGYVPSDMNGDNMTELSDLILTFNNAAAFVSEIIP